MTIRHPAFRLYLLCLLALGLGTIGFICHAVPSLPRTARRIYRAGHGRHEHPRAVVARSGEGVDLDKAVEVAGVVMVARNLL